MDFLKRWAVLFVLVCLNSINMKSQSIGYSFSYTLPFEELQENSQFFPFRNYKKSAEYSIGLTFNNLVKRVDGVQVRLSRYTATLQEERLVSPPDNAFTESAVTKYLIELESYFIDKYIYKGISMGIGVNYSYVLRSEHESFTEVMGMRTVLRDPAFDGIKKFKMVLLCKLNLPSISLGKNSSFTPSYVFGYSLNNDFKAKRPRSESLNHRFELTLFRNINQHR
ncbi:MAG: hypothetical protein P1U56_17845 [Saprospiraceae bacterium]|nr:hypothetical protein [Saprospiraceae bacterium]